MGSVMSAAMDSQTSTADLMTTLVQLGIGGVFVAFGASIYRRFELRGDQREAAHQKELEELRNDHKEELEKLRVELIEVLKNSRPTEG